MQLKVEHEFMHCGRWLLLTCWAWCLVNASAQDIVSHTQVVQSSKESIDFPLPKYEALPKTISFDPLTASEIQKIREDFFRALSAVDYGKAMYGENIGPTKCMQWILLRSEKESAWQAIGVMQQGKGIAKINAAFRVVSLSAGREIERGASGKYRPRDVPGSGGFWVTSFYPLDGYASYVKNRAAIHQTAYEFNIAEDKKTYSKLRFGSTKNLQIEKKRDACSFIKADCRRYAWSFDKVEWSIPPYFSEKYAQVSMKSLSRLEIAVEDMCPFDYEAAIEGVINTRLGGPGPGVKKYGLPKNTPLIEALRPYMSSVKN
jgi:hypothetical protein